MLRCPQCGSTDLRQVASRKAWCMSCGYLPSCANGDCEGPERTLAPLSRSLLQPVGVGSEDVGAEHLGGSALRGGVSLANGALEPLGGGGVPFRFQAAHTEEATAPSHERGGIQIGAAVTAIEGDLFGNDEA